MSFITKNSQPTLVRLLVILLAALLLSSTFCSGYDYCLGFSEREFEGAECLVTSETETPCQNYNSFSRGKALKFRCKTGYKYLTVDFQLENNAENLWHHSTCVGNNKWSNEEIKTFVCELDYGYFDSLRFTPLINGGTKIEQKTVPWNSAIFVTDQKSDDSSYTFICGGTLIHPSYILTAAHCLYDPDLIAASAFKIVLGGSTSVFNDVVGQENVQIFSVRERYSHPDYVGDYDYPNDIAVIELVGKVKISEFALPIKMPTAEQAQRIEESSWTLQVNGLGVTDNEKTASKALYALNVTSNSNACESFYAEHPTYLNREKTMCLSPVTGNSGICIGDSGSGTFLAWPTPTSHYFYIQGVVSAGFDPDGNYCNRITMFTKVWTYRAWVQDIIKNKRVSSGTSTNQPPIITVQPRTSAPTPASTRPTPRPTTLTTTPVPESVLQVGVNLHNDYRRQHRSPDLIPDATIQQAAREHCIYLANTFSLTAVPEYLYGQNLYQLQGPYISDEDVIRQAIEYWYSQINGYNWNRPPYSSTSQFTQMVWRATRFLGIHLERRGNRAVVVAMYYPKGNIDGLFKENVFPPQAGSNSQLPVQPTTNSPRPVINPNPNPVFANDWLLLGLKLHNDVRRKYRVSPMQLDQQLTNEAQAYADYIIQSNYNVSPKQGIPVGQNTFQNSGKSLDPSTAIQKAFDFWYSGASQYNFQFPLQSIGYAQLFSQIVWKSSLRLGLGIASQTDRTVVIAFYSPQGNVASEQSYKENVFPPYA